MGLRTALPVQRPSARPAPALARLLQFAQAAYRFGRTSPGFSRQQRREELQLVAGFAANPGAITGSTQEVWAFRANGRDIHQLSLPNDPRCQKTEYAAPTSLADGRPALVK